MKVTKINSGGYVKDIYMPSGKLIKVAIRHTDATKQYWELVSPALWKYVEKDKTLSDKFSDGISPSVDAVGSSKVSRLLISL